MREQTLWKGPERWGSERRRLSGWQETEGPRDLVKTGGCQVEWEMEESRSKQTTGSRKSSIMHHAGFVCVHAYCAPENVLWTMQKKDTVLVPEQLTAVRGRAPDDRVLTQAARV